MKSKKLFLWLVILALAMLLLSSCQRSKVDYKSRRKAGYGPPPHAPAHGYRHKYQGVELVYDSGHGVYVVIGFPQHYFYLGRFYRYHDLQWQVSSELDGPWEPIAEELLPPGLKSKEKGKQKKDKSPGRAKK